MSSPLRLVHQGESLPADAEGGPDPDRLNAETLVDEMRAGRLERARTCPPEGRPVTTVTIARDFAAELDEMARSMTVPGQPKVSREDVVVALWRFVLLRGPVLQRARILADPVLKGAAVRAAEARRRKVGAR